MIVTEERLNGITIKAAVAIRSWLNWGVVCKINVPAIAVALAFPISYT
jgi:hypothetical protein